MARALGDVADSEAERPLCRHCGLATAGDAYCCYGCELAAQIAAEAHDNHARVFGTLMFTLLLSMSVMMLSLFLYAGDVYDAGASAGLGWLRSFYRAAAAVLATPVMVLAGVPLLRRAAAMLARGRLSMDLLIGTGAFAAYGLSLMALFAGDDRVYFDSATAALVLATFGRYLEASARTRASALLGPALERVGQSVRVARDGDWVDSSPALVIPGTRLRIELEGMVPVDCEVCAEAAEIDLSIISGESRAATVHPGDVVPAGAVVTSDHLTAVALRAARESTLERLVALAESLRRDPADVVRVADRFAGVLVPLVWGVAGVTFAFWSSASTPTDGVVAALAVVLVACPCTYAIAAPLVLWLALRHALRHGVLVRDARAFEQLGRVRTVAFDKTGTLTEPAVTSVEIIDGAGESEVPSVVAALEAGASHPIGRALAVWCAGAEPATLGERRIVAGRGVEGIDGHGRRVSIAAAANGAVQLTRGGIVLARFTMGESLLESSRVALRDLDAAGIASVVISGDSRERTDSVAGQLGVDGFAAQTPQQKVERVRGLRGPVAMVGDGLNDVPALAAAGPSFAVARGAGLVRGMAAVSLLEPDLALVPWTLVLARRAVRLVHRLLAASTVYNLCFVALAATGMLRPLWAGLSMLISSLLSLAAALRVSRWASPESQS